MNFTVFLKKKKIDIKTQRFCLDKEDKCETTYNNKGRYINKI
jgi:hypothetical protein